MKIVVCSKHINSTKVSILGTYTNWEAAVNKITTLYVKDNESTMKGKYYYFACEQKEEKNG